MISKKDFIDLFLKLTEYTIPFQQEYKLEPLLPAGFKKDSIGNYYYEIGNSKTLFTSHLDTYSEKYQKVNHIVEGDIVKTDRKTILGGDNKLGSAILISMINAKKPGTYYFFLGEEPLTSGGLYGSRNALAAKPTYFQKFDRAIAFDRRKYGSIVTRQMGVNCCSVEFTEAIAENLLKYANSVWDKKGGYGYYTDSAVFMNDIHEVTNLSVGGFNEHYKDEYADLAYTYSIFKAAMKIDWESLPVVREARNRVKNPKFAEIKGFKKYNVSKLIDKISTVMNDYESLSLTNQRQIGSHIVLTYSAWMDNFDVNIIIDEEENVIFFNNKMTFKEFKQDIKDFGVEISE